MHQCQTLEKEKLLHLEITPCRRPGVFITLLEKDNIGAVFLSRNIAMISDKLTIWIEAFNNIQSVPMWTE